MRVLTRKEGESINIGDDVKVIVLDTPGTQKIGIVVPIDVPVQRSEICDKIKKGDKTGNQ